MTKEVEQRIVEMRFDNEQFEKGAKQTLLTLEKLDGMLDILGAQGLDHLGNVLAEMEYRFSRVGTVGTAVIQNLTNKAVNLASALLTAIPEQIISGGTQRALNVENARFQLKGLGIAWEEVADDIDHAVMGTAYGADEAAKAAAIIGASGVQYKNAAGEISDMGRVLRSISGIAAMTNSSYDDIANVMGDIFAMGKVTNGELQRFELRGLNVVAKLAEMSQNGTLRRVGVDAKYTEKQLRELIAKGGMDALTFAKAMDLAFGEHATEANETYTGALRNMRAALSRIGEKFIAPYHEGVRKVALALRELFNNSKAILTPFAEGTFTKSVELLSDKIVKLIQSIDLKWLQSVVNTLDKIDLEKFFKSFEGRGSKFLGRLKVLRSRLHSIFKTLKNITEVIAVGLGVAGKNAAKLSSEFSNKILGLLNKLFRAISRLNSSKLRKILYEEVAPRIVKVMNLLRSLGNTAWTAGEVIFAIGKKVFGIIRNSGVVRSFGQGFNSVADFIIAASDSLGEWLRNVRDLIENGPSAESTLGKIGSGFEAISGFVGNAVNAISTFLRYILGLKEGENVFTVLGKFAKSAGETIRNVFGYIRESIASAFGEDGVGKEAIKIAAAFYTILIGYRNIESKKFAFGRFGRVFEFIKELLTKSYDMIRAINPLQWADDIETLLRRTAGALRAFSDNLNAKSLLTIAGAVVALGFGLSILAGIAEGGHAVEAIGMLAVTMGLLLAALWGIKAITDQGLLKGIAKGWKGLFGVFKNSITKYLNAVSLKETATALILFASAIGILAVSVAILGYAFKKLEPANMWQAVGAIAVLSAVLVGAFAAISALVNGKNGSGGVNSLFGAIDSTKFAMIATMLISFSVSVLLLATAVSILGAATAKFGYGAVWSAVGMIVVLAGVLFGVAVGLSHLAKAAMLSAPAVVLIAAALDLLIIGLVALGAAVKFIGGDELWNAIGMIAVLGVVLFGIATGLSFLAPLAMLAAPAVVLIAAALDLLIIGLIALGAAVKIIGGKQLWNAIGMIATLGVIFVVLMAVIGLLSPVLAAAASVFVLFSDAAKNLSEAFVNIAGGMMTLALALNMMPADGSLEVIGKGLGALAGGLVRLGLSTAFMPAGDKDVFSGLVSIATAMTILEDIDIAKLTDKHTGLVALSDTVREAFGGAFFGLFGSLGSSLGAGNAGLLTAGPALLSLGEGLQALTPGLASFSQIQNPSAISDTLAELASAVVMLSADSTFGRRDYLSDLGNNLLNISTALGGLTTHQMTLLSKLGEALNKSFESNSGKSAEALANDLLALNEAIDKYAPTFIEKASAIPIYLETGIKNSSPKGIDAIKLMVRQMGNAFNSTGSSSTWRTIGSNIPVGIANGIYQNYNVPVNAMAKLAKSLQTTFTSALKIHSPSKVFEILTSYIPMAIANELIAGRTQVSTAMAECMGGAMSTMEQYSKTAAELTPMITPVMDVSAMRRDIQLSDRMFAGSQLGSFNGLNNMNVNGDAISYNMQNQDVVNAIVQLEYKIGQLGQTIQDMKLVMDTGVVVGALAPAMNTELGKTVVRERRQ